MEIILDTSVVIAVLVNEPQKEHIIENTRGKSVEAKESNTVKPSESPLDIPGIDSDISIEESTPKSAFDGRRRDLPR